jgi:uncharacterized lipoprotein YajG
MAVKKYIFRVMAVFTAAALSAFLLAGCKKAQTTQDAGNGRPGFNQTEMQQREKTELASLVTAGTITQALFSSMPGRGGGQASS